MANLDVSNQFSFINNQQDKIRTGLFGLHPNIEIMTNQIKLDQLLADLLIIQPSMVSATDASIEDIQDEKADDILQQIPAIFDIDALEEKFEIDYKESMNTVLTQEAQRFNILLTKIIYDLNLFKSANRGRIVMTLELEKMGLQLQNNEVPDNWSGEQGVGFTSTKSLSSWIIDLAKRVDFLKEWENQGTPKCFWMSGFFYPQAFLTGIKQNYARKTKTPIDLVDFEFNFINKS